MVSRQGILCRDRVLAKTKWSLIATEYFYVTIEFATEYFYVTIELARLGVFCRDIMFLCRDRVG